MKNLIILLCLLFTGCTMMHIRTKPGSATHTSPVGSVSAITQSEDPKSASTLQTESEKDETFILPAGTVIEEQTVKEERSLLSPRPILVTNVTKTTLSAPATKTVHIGDKSNNSIGAAQKNTVAELATELANARPLMWGGFLAMIVGMGAAFWPAARLFLGGPKPGFAIAGIGLSSVIIAMVVPGNTTAILIVAGLIAVVLAAWFLLTHGGHVRELKILREQTADDPAPTTK